MFAFHAKKTKQQNEMPFQHTNIEIRSSFCMVFFSRLGVGSEIVPIHIDYTVHTLLQWEVERSWERYILLLITFDSNVILSVNQWIKATSWKWQDEGITAADSAALCVCHLHVSHCLSFGQRPHQPLHCSAFVCNTFYGQLGLPLPAATKTMSL